MEQISFSADELSMEKFYNLGPRLACAFIQSWSKTFAGLMFLNTDPKLCEKLSNAVPAGLSGFVLHTSEVAQIMSKET